MTDKLHCPFCGAELKNSCIIGEFYCPTVSKLCPMRGSLLKIVWQALIDGKKAQGALKVATDCIENIGNTWRGDQRWSNDDMGEIRINIENYCDGTLQKIKELKK